MFLRLFTAHIRKYDWVLAGAVFFLAGLGLMTLFSLSTASKVPFFNKQIVWCVIGLSVMIGASFIDFRLFRTQSAVALGLYGVSLILLLFVVASGLTVRGISAWFRIGGVAVQPVELAKLALIILLAKYFSKRHIEIYQLRHIVISGGYFLLPTALVLVQPDLGSALMLAGVWMGVLIFSGIRIRHAAILVMLGALTAVLAWFFLLAPYQRARVTAFIDPYADALGVGYQPIQSMIAVGSGQLWGKGLGYGSQTQLHFLPEAESDFIFAAFAEEWGFVGVILMFALLFTVVWRIVLTGMRTGDSFSRLYAIGLSSLIFLQSFVHIGANLGVLPITGITLPFVSYGGSSIVVLFAGIGILQNIKINSRRATILDAG